MSNNGFMNENPSETKILMAETLKKMIKDRPFSKITVQDIVGACNINRNTFYYHFEIILNCEKFFSYFIFTPFLHE